MAIPSASTVANIFTHIKFIALFKWRFSFSCWFAQLDVGIQLTLSTGNWIVYNEITIFCLPSINWTVINCLTSFFLSLFFTAPFQFSQLIAYFRSTRTQFRCLCWHIHSFGIVYCTIYLIIWYNVDNHISEYFPLFVVYFNWTGLEILFSASFTIASFTL